MRCIVVAALAVFVVLAGCRSSKAPTETGGTSAGSKAGQEAPVKAGMARDSNSTNSALVPIVLPTSGRVERVNLGKRFVVIDYTLGGLPPAESVVNVYRNGVKVGELRLSGPAMHGFATADILEGFIQVDDEVRVY